MIDNFLAMWPSFEDRTKHFQAKTLSISHMHQKIVSLVMVDGARYKNISLNYRNTNEKVRTSSPAPNELTVFSLDPEKIIDSSMEEIFLSKLYFSMLSD